MQHIHKVSLSKIWFVMLMFQTVYMTEIAAVNLATQASSVQKPMNDEERTDHIEHVMKANFAKIFAGIINALQNPKEKAQYVADCINAMLNIIWEATTKDKTLDAWEEIFTVINEICDSIEDKEIAEEIKKIIQEDHDARMLAMAQNR